MARSRQLPWIWIGVTLLLFGLQFHAIDAVVLKPSTTRWLSKLRAKDTPKQMVEQFALQSDSIARYEMQTPDWLAWAFSSAGVVMIVNGLLLKKTVR